MFKMPKLSCCLNPQNPLGQPNSCVLFSFIVSLLFFHFFEKKKRGADSRVVIIVLCPTIQLGKSMGTTNSNWSLETPNPHTPQALLVSETSRNCNYSPRENSNMRCDETSAITYQLYHTCWWLQFLLLMQIKRQIVL